jgi:hypothetical protein
MAATARLLRNRARTWRRKAAAIAPAREADELHIEARAFEQLADAMDGVSGCPHGRPYPAECPECKAAFIAGIDAAVAPAASGEPLPREQERGGARREPFCECHLPFDGCDGCYNDCHTHGGGGRALYQEFPDMPYKLRARLEGSEERERQLVEALRDLVELFTPDGIAAAHSLRYRLERLSAARRVLGDAGGEQ